MIVLFYEFVNSPVVVTSVSTKVDPIVTVVTHKFDPDFLSQYALPATSLPMHRTPRRGSDPSFPELYIILFIDWRFDPRSPERQRPTE